MDEADRAQHHIEQLDAIREQQRLARQAQELKAWAITECKLCGETIEPARKAVVPATKLCAECAGLDEMRQKGRR